jgi:hypothetical protein
MAESGRFVPLRLVVVSIRGVVVKDEWLKESNV